jgi:hypothetical protein
MGNVRGLSLWPLIAVDALVSILKHVKLIVVQIRRPIDHE